MVSRLYSILFFPQKYHHTVLAVGGDLEISMLRYDFEQTKFVLRVLKGRNLPSRDLPSQTSDPYVKVSIIPDWNNEGPQQTSTISGIEQFRHINSRSNHEANVSGNGNVMVNLKNVVPLKTYQKTLCNIWNYLNIDFSIQNNRPTSFKSNSLSLVIGRTRNL